MDKVRPVEATTDEPGTAPASMMPAVATALPAVSRLASTSQRRWARVTLALFVMTAAVAGGTYWWTHRLPALPEGIAEGNGRIEADPLDIDTKFAGRIFELRVDEGDMVKTGQILALMDTRDLAESLKKAEAQVERARKAISEAEANSIQLRTQTILAEQEFERTSALVKNGWATKELLDQRSQQLEGAHAAERAGIARLDEAQHALEAATHDVELYKVNIADNTLVAPRDGRIEYRIANVGEVLPAGGKVFTMLDVGYVYMDVYLPTLVAGRVKLGDGARIVLDAYPDIAIPAKVTFVASQAQFTPKMVETQTERDKLMFRIRVRIDPDRLRAHADAVRSGLPGVAYVRFDPKTVWPERLQGTP